MPFVAPRLHQNLRLIVEVAFGFSINSAPGTWVWTDITKYVQLNTGGSPLSLAAGAPDQAQDADPSQIVLTLANTDGRFTALNPGSPYYPNVVRNVPLRVSMTWDGATASYELLTAFVNGWPIQPNAGVINVTVPITATGRLRRLRASGAQVFSALRGSVAKYAPVLAYWPLENGNTQIIVKPLPPRRAYAGPDRSVVVRGHPTWTAPTNLPASDTLPVFDGFTGLSASILGAFSGTGFSVDWYMNIPTTFTGSAVIMSVSTPVGVGGFSRFEIVLTPTAVNLNVYIEQLSGTTLSVSVSTTPDDMFGSWQHMRLQVDNGTSAELDWIGVEPAVTTNHTLSTGLAPITVGNPTSWSIPADPDLIGASFGHVFFTDFIGNTAIDNAGTAWTGELAPDRVTRVCAENNLPVTVTTSTSIPAQAMGPQVISTVATILSDAAHADNGLLHDAGTLGNLVYNSGTLRYNAAIAFTLNYNQHQIGDGLAATYDDQQLVTDWAISDNLGHSATFHDPNASDDYTRSSTLNVASYNQCLNEAGWNVHLGTYDAYRIPSISIDIRGRNPELAQFVTPLSIPCRISPANLPSPYPAASFQSFDQFIEGWSALVDSVTWQMQFNCSPYAPWAVAVVDDATTGIVDSDNSTLGANITVSTTSFTVNVGTAWTTSAGDFPLDINIGGERIRLSSISGSAPTQTFNVAAGGRGFGLTMPMAHNLNDPVHVWNPAIVAL